MRGKTNSVFPSSNQNLLDNAWFTINQRGQSSYNGGYQTYTVDRWCNTSDKTTTYVVNDGIKLTDTVDDGLRSQFRQRIEKENLPWGKQITLSFMIKGDEKHTVQFGCWFSNTDDSNFQVKNVEVSTDWQIFSKTITLPSSTRLYNGVFIHSLSANNLYIKCAKLEVGTKSTLEYDAPPNYTEELLKCQRHFVATPYTDNTGTTGGNTMYCQTTPALYGGIQFPVMMRATPVISNLAARDIFTGEETSNLTAKLINQQGFNALEGITGTTGHVYAIRYEASADL